MSTPNSENVSNKNSASYISFHNYFQMALRMWALFLIFAVVGGVVGYIYASKTYTPVYTASTTFTINVKKEQSITMNSDFYDNVAAEQMAETFPYILTSNLLHRKVEADMGKPVTATINASVVENTNLLTLSVTDTNPNVAYETLEAVIANYPSVSEPIVGKVTMKVLDKTGVPTQSDNPKDFSKTIYSGVLYGIIVAVLWSLLVYIVNRTIVHKSEIKDKLQIECLGVIPKITEKKRSKAKLDYFLITDKKIKGVLDEPFRMVRNKVEYSAQKNNYKTFLVTSATPAEGKSLFAANLSLSLSNSGSKVILIDCDMRHPTGRMVFNIAQGDGLREYLNGDLSLMEYIDTAKKNNPHTTESFLFLPGGKPITDGSTLLSSARMQKLIDYAKQNADYVIIDSAPTGILTDSAVVAKYIDASILVIRQDFARIDIINDALSHLSQSDTTVIGGVLNDAK